MFPYNQLTRNYCRKTSWHEIKVYDDDDDDDDDEIDTCISEKFSTTIQFCRCHRAPPSCARCYETKPSMHVTSANVGASCERAVEA
ncbi:hypothetical protein T12_2525 [Trichinella patagoniensis]|uniref:Uncharacterized protein n=1 Tax=Trichinella patagoniensis TaxID=990121 RepID=A0A0V1A1T9_9BILA|nr:hypothetical protein T12_2525 [Trichinella patagoniensis]